LEQFLQYEWVALLITGLGTLFLIGEVLVNMRGVFALLGIGFISVYFTIYQNTNSLLLMLIIYFIGLLLIIIDGKLINDGTLAILGVASMLTSVALAADNFASGLYAVIGVLIGGGSAFTFPKVFPSRDLWSKITLRDRLTEEDGYSTMNQEYAELVGKTGKTLTDLRPIGTIEIDGQEYSAISNAQWIYKGSLVKVIKVDGTRILVSQEDS